VPGHVHQRREFPGLTPADPDVGQPSGHACTRTQITRFRAAASANRLPIITAVPCALAPIGANYRASPGFRLDFARIAEYAFVKDPCEFVWQWRISPCYGVSFSAAPRMKSSPRLRDEGRSCRLNAVASAGFGRAWRSCPGGHGLLARAQRWRCRRGRGRTWRAPRPGERERPGRGQREGQPGRRLEDHPTRMRQQRMLLAAVAEAWLGGGLELDASPDAGDPADQAVRRVGGRAGDRHEVLHLTDPAGAEKPGDEDVGVGEVQLLACPARSAGAIR